MSNIKQNFSGQYVKIDLLIIAENAEEHILDHVDDITDEEACDEFYEGCGAVFQEIDYSTYMEEAFEDYERKEDCV